VWPPLLLVCVATRGTGGGREGRPESVERVGELGRVRKPLVNKEFLTVEGAPPQHRTESSPDLYTAPTTVITPPIDSFSSLYHVARFSWGFRSGARVRA
jgi:hypothetical protein